jgi:CRP-like cAMP-binding protein
MPHIDALVRKLRTTGNLSDNDVQAMRRLPVVQRDFAAKQAIFSEGDRPESCSLVVKGLCVRSKVTDEGKRQILSLHMCGEIPDLRTLHLPILDHDLCTQTACTIGFIPHEALRTLTRERPLVADALWREALVDAAVSREWIVNLGRRSAKRRLAHFILEMREKLSFAGLSAEDSFGLPITQTDMADALGLTPVHVNRVLKSLRESGVLDIKRNEVMLSDPEKLAAIGEFNAVYLSA